MGNIASTAVNNYFKVSGSTPEFRMSPQGYWVRGEARTFLFCDRSAVSTRTAWNDAEAYASHGVSRRLSIYRMSPWMAAGPWNQVPGVGIALPDFRFGERPEKYAARCKKSAVQAWRITANPALARVATVEEFEEAAE